MADDPESVVQRRRQRILAKSAERLARITGEASASVVDPLHESAEGESCPAPDAQPSGVPVAPPEATHIEDIPSSSTRATTLRQRKPDKDAPITRHDADAHDTRDATAHTAAARLDAPDASGDDAAALADKEVPLPTLAATVNAAVFSTKPFRFAVDAAVALIALRTTWLTATVTPVVLLVLMNLMLVLSTALFYRGSIPAFRDAAAQQRLREDGGGMLQMVQVLLQLMGMGAAGAIAQAMMALTFALYIDSSVYLVCVVSLSLLLRWLGL